MTHKFTNTQRNIFHIEFDNWQFIFLKISEFAKTWNFLLFKAKSLINSYYFSGSWGISQTISTQSWQDVGKNRTLSTVRQRYTYRVLQTIQMKLILLSVWAEPAVMGSAKTALKFKYKIQIGYYSYTVQCMWQFISFKSEINNPWFNPWFILLHTHSNVCATVEG